MKSPYTTKAIDNKPGTRTQVSLGLTLAGIVTAILCALALLHDTYTAGSERIPGFIQSSSTSVVSALITSASALVSSFGNTVMSITTSLVNS